MNMSNRIMALDIGKKKIGVAISDPLGISANPWGYIEATGKKKIIEKISGLLSDYNVKNIVVGVPKNMDGSVGSQAQYCMDLANDIKKVLGVEITFVDERLTSREVDRLLIDAGVSRQKRKDVNDKLAASIILQNFLQSRNKL